MKKARRAKAERKTIRRQAKTRRRRWCSRNSLSENPPKVTTTS
jgi:hypothetical protein